MVDNTDRRIDVDNDEVTIGRKYYRSGDSEYSVNGQNARLKDIYELFLDTGLGRGGAFGFINALCLAHVALAPGLGDEVLGRGLGLVGDAQGVGAHVGLSLIHIRCV